MEDIHKESCINIHSNKGKHGYYLHFSGYESGELRQEEKQYEETAADRDWKRGKLRKRLVYISNKDTNCFHTGRSFPLQTCHPDTSNNQQFFCRDNTRPSKQWLQWHANTRRPAGYLNSWPTFSAMISISPQLLCSSPPTHCAGQPALPPLSQKCLSAVLLLEPLLHAEFYYTKTSLRRGKKKKKKGISLLQKHTISYVVFCGLGNILVLCQVLRLCTCCLTACTTCETERVLQRLLW